MNNNSRPTGTIKTLNPKEVAEALKHPLTETEAKKFIRTLDTSKWRKTIADREQEIKDNEVRFIRFHGEILSVARVGICEITRGDGKRLVETHQIYTDGGRTARGIPVSGKISFGGEESVEEGMLRELMEELSLPMEAFEELVHVKDELTLTESQLYAGQRYILYAYYFKTKIKPKYIKQEYVERQPKKSSYFGWV